MSNTSVGGAFAGTAALPGEAAPRVLELVGSFDLGGSERQAVQLAGLLQNSGAYTVRMATLQPGGILRAQAESLGVGEIPCYPLASFYDRNFLSQVRRFAADLRKLGVAIIHTHEFYSNIFGMLAARLAAVPVRIASRRDLGTMRSWAQSWVERRAYAVAHAVVVNSEAVRRQLIRDGVPARKISVIYNGLDAERFLPQQSSRTETLHLLQLPDGEGPMISLVANFRHPVKDQATFVRAAEQVRKSFPSARFVLAGEGPLLADARDLVRQLGIGANVFFIGRCDHVAELLALSSVCVLSSRSEGFSNAILEYMAAARPVVATDTGGARECMIEAETGYLVAAGDAASMAARILDLLRHPDRAESMGRRGRQVVQQHFSKEAQLKYTDELYSRLLAARGVSLGSQHAIRSINTHRQ